MRLYELAASYEDLQQAAENGEDVSERLDQLADAIEAKGAALAAVLRGLDAEAEAFRSEEQRLSDRRRAIESNRDRIRLYIRGCMESAGIAQIKAGTFSIILSDGPPSVTITDESKVDPAYKREKREIVVDKRGILAAYRDTGEIPEGCEIVNSTALRIR